MTNDDVVATERYLLNYDPRGAIDYLQRFV